jgi:hypothetical protein
MNSSGSVKEIMADFEVRHPCCVSQITQLNSRRLKVKTQLIIYILYAYCTALSPFH